MILAVFFMGMLSLPAHAGGLSPRSLEVRIQAQVEKKYPEYILHNENLMDKSITNWKLYRENVGDGHPGIVCGRFRTSGNIDCAVLLAEKSNPTYGAVALYYVLNADSSSPLVFPLEHYEKEIWNFGNDKYLHYLRKDYISDQEKYIYVMMKSNGFEMAAGERVAYAYYWNDNNLIKIFTVD